MHNSLCLISPVKSWLLENVVLLSLILCLLSRTGYGINHASFHCQNSPVSYWFKGTTGAPASHNFPGPQFLQTHWNLGHVLAYSIAWLSFLPFCWGEEVRLCTESFLPALGRCTAFARPGGVSTCVGPRLWSVPLVILLCIFRPIIPSLCLSEPETPKL